MPEFVEFAGKNPYKCLRCKMSIRYARFFGDDKKLLTTDGKPANNKFGKDSNTGWATDPVTKQMHVCPPKDVPESELKKTETLDSGWRATAGTGAAANTLDSTVSVQVTADVDEDIYQKWKPITDNDDEIHAIAKYQVVKQQPDIPDSVLGAAVSAKESNLNMIRLIKILAERKNE